MKRRNQTHRDIKIATDVNVIQHNHKAPGGLMKAVFELKDEMIKDLSLSGDYFCYPSDLDRQIEELIEGKKFNEITGILEDFYDQNEIETPGITPADWAKVIIG
jgi:hypothetical protein